MTSAPERKPRPWRKQPGDEGDNLLPNTPLDRVMLSVGRIVSAHGVRGEVKMDIFSDRPEEIPKLRRIYFNDDPTPHAISRPRGTDRQVIFKITGIESRSEAEALRGTVVRIQPSQFTPREDDSFYHYQLVGLSVFLEDGTPIGTLTEILETGEVDVYVVHDADGKEQLFPALKDVVIEIDPAADRVVIRPLEYEDA